MNNERRKTITTAIEELEHARQMIEEAGEDERNYADEMPENLQTSERFEMACEAADILEQAAGEIESIIAQVEEAKG